MEITAAGIDADTVIPTRSPRYAFAAPKRIARRHPSTAAVTENSGITLSAGIYGLKSVLFSICLSSILLFSPDLFQTSVTSPIILKIFHKWKA